MSICLCDPGSHITPVIRYVDDIIFEKLEEDENVCTVHGYSFSTVRCPMSALATS